jgi:hypothetical protein
MPSTFTTSCRFELQETGTNLNQWGVVLNARAIAMIDQAVDGFESIDLASGATFDLSSATYTKNGESDTSRRRVLRFTNSNAAGTAITIPSVTKNYWIINAGSYPITFAPSGGATASVPAGTSAFIWTDGTDCFAFRARLNELAAPNGSVAMGSQKITGLAAGTLDTDAVNKLQVTTLTAASVQLANDWAQKISDFVTGSDNSAKSWAIGGTGNGDPTAGSAKEWATSTSTVDGGLKGARGYANDASASATSASGFSTAASGYATTALGHSNTASGFATAASGSATSAANTLLDFQDKYVNNAGAGTFPASGNFSGRVAWSGSAFGVYNGSGWDALTSTPAATELIAGIVRFSTLAETNTGTSDATAVSAKNLAESGHSVKRQYQEFLSSGTYSVPAGATWAYVELIGGGGGGSRGNATIDGCGGGGGAFNSRLFRVSDITSSVAVTVGAGGVSSSAVDYTAGGDGGDSSFGSYLSAMGGKGAPINSTGGGAGGAGTPGATGPTTLSNGYADAGGGTRATSNAFSPGRSVKGGGGGGGSVSGGTSQDGGNGGAGTATASTNGGAGTQPGGGGGGCRGNGSGAQVSGAGGAGRARVWAW